VDLTDVDGPESVTMRERFRITAMPTFVFLRGDGRENGEARLEGFVSPQEFIASIESSAR
jgi:thioredoxin-related protein